MTASPNPSETPSLVSRRTVHFYCCTLFYWAGVYIYMPILSPYAEKVSGSLKAVGLIVGAYGLSQLLLRIPLGLWSDRLRRRKPFILLGFIFDGIACLGLIFSESTLSLFLSVFSAGIASSMWVAFTVLYSSYFPISQVSQSMSLLHFSMRFSQVLSNYSGGAIAEAWGWTAPFYAGLIFSGIGLILALGIKERPVEVSSGSSWRRLLNISRHPRLLRVSFFALLMQFTIFAVVYSFTPLYAHQIGASKAELGLLIFCFLVPNTITSLASGTLARFLQERYIISAAFLLTAIPVFTTPFAPRLEILYLLLGMHGIGTGFIFPLLMGLAIKPMPSDQRATAMGFFQCIYAVGMSMGPILSGWVGESWGLNSVYLLNGAMCLLAGLCSLKALK